MYLQKNIFMQIPVIQIGNSKGIRLSKEILKRYHIGNQLNLVFKENYFIVEPTIQPRKGWAEAFKQMHQNGDDVLEIDAVFNDENFDQWN